jgi:nucleoside-diphosphate-sugar epimerase
MNNELRRVWRQKLRETWRDVRPIAFVLAGLTVIVLGTWGYMEKEPSFRLVDALYRAPGLFGTSGNIDPPVPWQFEVARWLGPLLFGIAALRVLYALFRQEARLLWIRLFVRDHVVVAGLGEKGFRIVTGLHEAGHRVIVIEREKDNPRVPGIRERGITVLDGDATDSEVLRRAQVGRAEHLLAVCGDDGTNVDACVAAEGLAADRRSGVLTALAHLQDRRLWFMLSSAAIGSDQPTFRLEFFNVWVHGAHALLAAHPPFAGQPRPHVLIAGLDGVGEHLVLRVAAEWRAVRPDPRSRAMITLAGPGAGRHATELRAAHPELAKLCDVVPLEELRPPAQAPTRTYVSLADETYALAFALELRAANPGTPVVVAVADENSGVARALRAEGRVLGGVEPFGVLSRALTPDLLGNADTEVLARAKHDEYVRAEARRGITAADNRSLSPWDELPAALKDSNRRFADGISAKLAAAGCVLVPAPLADPEDPGFTFTEDEVEEMAVQEHDRWWRDLERDGWTATDGPKDPERKLHPLLVPWQELSEDDRDRDRDPVREIPAMLARAGFRLVRVQQGDQP